MRVLIGCEDSGRVRRAFRARGHDAWSCDLNPARDRSRYHYQMDVRRALDRRRWDLFIVFPDCTYLCSSGLHWNTRRPGRRRHTRAAIAFVRELLDADVDRKALENPIGCLSTAIRRPDQIIQPHRFGDDASKRNLSLAAAAAIAGAD